VFAMNGTVAVSMGHGDGTFAATTQLSGTFPGTYLGIAVTDFNVTATRYRRFGFGLAQRRSRKTRFLCGNGDGTFVSPTSVDLMATFPSSLANGDFNGDGNRTF